MALSPMAGDGATPWRQRRALGHDFPAPRREVPVALRKILPPGSNVTPGASGATLRAMGVIGRAMAVIPGFMGVIAGLTEVMATVISVDAGVISVIPRVIDATRGPSEVIPLASTVARALREVNPPRRDFIPIGSGVPPSGSNSLAALGDIPAAGSAVIRTGQETVGEGSGGMGAFICFARHPKHLTGPPVVKHI